MLYEDFREDQEKPNTCWCWVQKDDGSYVWEEAWLNNAVAGDTDSAMFSLSEIFEDDYDDIDTVVEVADAIGEISNESFPDFCKFAFNCPDDRTYFIKTEREVVSDKSLFLSKKRYIMHIVDNEGERANKLKIQGVELKKSDTSAAVKDMLNELVMMILDNKEMDEVVERVSQMRNEFKQRPVHEIAVPCNTKTLTKVQKGYEATGSLKGAHYSAKSAFWWNKMKTPQDQEVYAGQKVGLVYVKHPKFDSIGFPIDLETLPDWFNKIPINYDVMWEKAYKKLTNYLKAVEWDIESRRENKKKELFGF